MTYASNDLNAAIGPLSILKPLLAFKIVVTFFAWALQFLLLPVSVLEQGMGPVPEPIFQLRMLGWAYLALCVGYFAGLLEARRGRMPWGVVAMALVSNGGSAALLGSHLLFGGGAELTGWPLYATWATFAVLLFIMTVLLIVALWGSRNA